VSADKLQLKDILAEINLIRREPRRRLETWERLMGEIMAEEKVFRVINIE
jgi:hypothetical protein